MNPCVTEALLWKQLSWPPSLLPHPVPAVSQQLHVIQCPPPLLCSSLLPTPLLLLVVFLPVSPLPCLKVFTRYSFFKKLIFFLFLLLSFLAGSPSPQKKKSFSFRCHSWCQSSPSDLWGQHILSGKFVTTVSPEAQYQQSQWTSNEWGWLTSEIQDQPQRTQISPHNSNDF